MTLSNKNRMVGRIRRGHAVLLVACLTMMGDRAAAQSTSAAVKPYVLLLFDTSGSMLWPVRGNDPKTISSVINGDNSAECPGADASCAVTSNTTGCGNGLKDDARLFKVKRGAHSVVNAFGEVVFGLARFHNPPAAFVCDPAYNGRAGGWKGVTCGGALGTGGNSADILVGFSANNGKEVLSWMNNCDDYPTPGACSAANLAPPTGCSLCADCGTGCDKELRGVGATPLAGSLYSVRDYLNTKVLPTDPKRACRPYKVILLTDGLESCGGKPEDEAAALFKNVGKSIPVHVVGFGDSALKTNLETIAKAGGTNSAVVVDNEVSLALAMANIISGSVLTETCNGKDDDCDGLCDETWTEVAVSGSSCTATRAATACTVGVGVCKNSGVYVCKKDGSGSVCSATPGTAGTEVCNNRDDDCDGQIDEGNVCGGSGACVEQAEVCNGKDDNCDGKIDENYAPKPCGKSIGECKAGTTSCVNGKVVCKGGKGPSVEICNGKDDNCDGVVDQLQRLCYPYARGCTGPASCAGRCKYGTESCPKGSWEPCRGAVGPAAAETCNGIDDDCDNAVDEGLIKECVNYYSTPPCQKYKTCSPCLTAPPELCNNLDDNCKDGVDESPVVGEGTTCGTNVGACEVGVTKCVTGKLVCTPKTGPTVEQCNNTDDDCNGLTDDNVPGEGRPCGASDTGECKKGKDDCQAGKWVCVGEVTKSAEICDCKDNDCNGTVDDNALCPGSGRCVDCKCQSPCSKEFCPGGTKCVSGYCVPDPCAKITCKKTEYCLEGKCVNNCQGVTCRSSEKCDPNTGFCVDNTCATNGCPAGQRCINATCVADPCAPGKCPADEVCNDGVCHRLCANVTCGPKQICVDGACVPQKPCDVKICPDIHVCKEVNDRAVCEPDPCRVITCKSGSVCINGTCVVDPCAATRCPKGFVCQLNTRNTPRCTFDGPLVVTKQVAAEGSGVISCSASADAPPRPTATLLILAGLWAMRRRRGRRGEEG